ncbi:MAG: DUF3304 domain-containing protein [Comamonadaceae bacterium]|nr:MAG: DUF3304 domain-containing protein [Comamonadaceae bacterium]
MKRSQTEHGIDGSPRRIRAAAHASLMLWLGAALLLVATVSMVLWKQDRERTFGVPIVGYNHTGEGIDFFVSGSMGGNIPPHGGGGRHACCVDLPAHYKAGMEVEVKWEATASGPGEHIYQSRRVSVPEYDSRRVGLFAVHFMPDKTIKVLATYLYYEHPDYPIKDSF